MALALAKGPVIAAANLLSVSMVGCLPDIEDRASGKSRGGVTATPDNWFQGAGISARSDVDKDTETLPLGSQVSVRLVICEWQQRDTQGKSTRT